MNINDATNLHTRKSLPTQSIYHVNHLAMKYP